MDRRLSRCLCLVGILLLARDAHSADEFRIGDPLPQAVIKAWEKRREACRSAHWKLKCRELITKGLLNMSEADLKAFGPRPKEDEWREREKRVWIDFPTLRIRCESEGMGHFTADDGTTPLIFSSTASLFDGKSLQEIKLPKGDLAEHVPDGQFQGLVFERCQVPHFWGHGIVFGPGKPFSANLLNAPLETDGFRIHSVRRDGDSELLIVRASIHQTEPGNYVEYTIDPARNAAIVGMSLHYGGKLRSQTSVVWSRIDNDWKPESWKAVSYRLDGTLAISGEFTVLEQTCDPDLSKIVFHVTPEVGTAYLDERTRSTLVKAPASQPDIPQPLYEIQQASQKRRLKWYAAAGIVAVACGIWWRRRLSQEV